MTKRDDAVAHPFDYEFHSEVEQPLEEIRAEVESRLRRLADGHNDMIGATVSLEEPAENRSTPFIYRARIVAFIRPENLAATEQAATPEGALKGALHALERQVRERRARLRERWQHDHTET